ncbi:hypothetical protein [Pontibacillus litoralis]|uniref:Sigma-X negative effector n=1 Tax=Pontibacillus litoralis JSM 072002 TaxID=1385512 RepID=A0A0A5G1X5_9BACI|nr:hypothetical protein [Pontibacillus litoralis]KGX86014.1 hypothetical protein N784_06150 [Pontibacillus litoralis JSM 072002]
MKKHNQYEKQMLQHLLTQMPTIEDTQSKESLYHSVINRMKEEPLEKKVTWKSSKLFSRPVVMVTSILIFMLISFPLVWQQMSKSDVVQMVRYSSPLLKEEDLIVDSHFQNEVSTDLATLQKQYPIAEQEGTETNERFDKVHASQPSLTTTVREGQQQATVGVPTKEGDAIVPISFVVSNQLATIDEMYHYIAESIETEKLGLGAYLLRDVSFTREEGSNRIVARFPEQFLLPKGVEQEQNLLESLQVMSQTSNVDTIQLQQGDTPGVLFPHKGMVYALDLNRMHKRAYELYQGERFFLVPLPLEEDTTIEEAIDEMYQSYGDSKAPLIPEDVQFSSIQSVNENTLAFTFQAESSITDSFEYIAMIEGIMMTAKSFQYEYVKFYKSPVVTIGPYNMEELIAIPTSINPISVPEMGER